MPTGKKQVLLPQDLQLPLQRLRQTVGDRAPQFLEGITSWTKEEYKKRPYRWVTPISFSNREVQLIAMISIWTRRSQARDLIKDGCEWDRQRNLPTQENLSTLLQVELQEAREWAKMLNRSHKADDPDPQIEMIMEFPDWKPSCGEQCRASPYCSHRFLFSLFFWPFLVYRSPRARVQRATAFCRDLERPRKFLN